MAKEREYILKIPTRGVLTKTVTARSGKEAIEKYDSMSLDVESVDAYIDWTGRPRVILERS